MASSQPTGTTRRPYRPATAPARDPRRHRGLPHWTRAAIATPGTASANPEPASHHPGHGPKGGDGPHPPAVGDRVATGIPARKIFVTIPQAVVGPPMKAPPAVKPAAMRAHVGD